MSPQDLTGKENFNSERSNATSQVQKENLALAGDSTKIVLPLSPTISSEVAGKRGPDVPSLHKFSCTLNKFIRKDSKDWKTNAV
jgi:hypothetical protein